MKTFVLVGVVALLSGALSAAPTPPSGSLVLDQTGDIRLAGVLSFHGTVQNVPTGNAVYTAVYIDCDNAAGVEVVDYWYVTTPFGSGSFDFTWGAYSITPTSWPTVPVTCRATLFFNNNPPTRFYKKVAIKPSNTLATVAFAVAGG